MDEQQTTAKEEVTASHIQQTQQSLNTLVIAAQQGDLEAFSEIVQRFRGMAYASTYTLLGNTHLAEDIMQEAFIEAYLNLSKLREPAAFPGWFKRILFKQGDRLTRGKQLHTIPLEPTATFDIAQDELNPAVVVEHDEMLYLVHHAINTLPTHERIVTILFYANGYPLKDISAFLEVPVSTLKKRLFDARKHLKGRLQRVVREAHNKLDDNHDKDFLAHIQLLIAVRASDIDKVKIMLDRAPLLINGPLGWNVKHTAQHVKKTYSITLSGHSTALLEAVKYGHPELVTLLLDYGANCNIRGNDGLTPLQKAVITNQMRIVTLLLDQAAHVDMQSAAGLTALHLSTMGGTCEIAELLLRYHAKINAVDQGGRTPLHWAALRGQRSMVSLLLQLRADRTMQDELQRTPLDWARERNHQEIVELLQRQP
jgi:RNA polymerase sigma factor (sigma-70 family)